MKLTNEQTDILSAVKKGDEVIKVNAFAGTGKTTTLVEIAKANPNKKILYLAFNKAIQEEAKQKFPKNTEVRTTHSLAYKHIVYPLGFKNIRPDYKIGEIKEILELPNFDTAKIIENAYSFYCNSDMSNISSISLKTYFLNKTQELFDLMLNKKIDITHSFYLKLFQLYLKNKKVSLRPYDIVLLDEAQDTNDVTLDIFHNIPAKQRIIVGDTHQQIYSFRGSINAMSKIKGTELYLTNSFRFNEGIADKANEVLRVFKNEKQILKGKGNKLNSITSTAYISRTNSHLIGIMSKLLKDNKKFKTVRNPYEIFALAMNVYNLENKRELDKNFLYLKNLAPDMEKLEQVAIEIEDKELISAVNIVKKYDSSIFNIYKKAKEYFYEDFESDIFLTTAHTSKGLEWDSVIIENDVPNIPVKVIAKWIKESGEEYAFNTDFLAEFNQAVKDLRVNQKLIDEINLYYVAITRSKGFLTDNSENAEIDFEDKDEINEIIYNSLKEQEK